MLTRTFADLPWWAPFRRSCRPISYACIVPCPGDGASLPCWRPSWRSGKWSRRSSSSASRLTTRSSSRTRSPSWVRQTALEMQALLAIVSKIPLLIWACLMADWRRKDSTFRWLSTFRISDLLPTFGLFDCLPKIINSVFACEKNKAIVKTQLFYYVTSFKKPTRSHAQHPLFKLPVD